MYMENLTWFETYGKKYHLKTPITLTLSEYETGFYAENIQYGIAGAGNNKKDAIEDTRRNLGFLYEWKFDTSLPMPAEIPEWLEKIDKLME